MAGPHAPGCRGQSAFLPSARGSFRSDVTGPGWGIHNFELALRRWWREYSPSAEQAQRLRNWRDELESQGIIVMEPWMVVSDADEFIGRIPDTPVIVSGVLVPYEQLVIVHAFVGS